MIRRPYLLVFALCLAVGCTALAQIGEPPPTIVEPLVSQGATPADDGWYVGAEGFRFRVVERGGLAFRVEGEGELTEANAAFAARVIGAASGLGDGIQGPVETFFADRSPELAGQGRVAVGLDAFVLSLEIEGEAPYDVAFSLAFAQLDEASFPTSDHVLGPADARYVIREFSDFQCPFCSNFALQALPFIKGALIERGDVRFEYHHFPLQSIHANAAPAAEAAECVTEANDPEDFWTYHDALFERQQAWAQLGEPNAYFVRLAADLGLSIEGVEVCLEERRHAEAVAAAYQIAAEELRLTGTPTVFVNGFRVSEFLDLESYLTLFDRIDAFAQEESAAGSDAGDEGDAP